MLEEPTVPPAKFILNVHRTDKLAVQLECHSQCGKADDSNFLKKQWMENEPGWKFIRSWPKKVDDFCLIH